MSYTTVNYPSKKALQTAFKSGTRNEIANSGLKRSEYTADNDYHWTMFPQDKDGDIVIEGPHYPKAHTFYQKATIKDGIVVKLNK